MDKFTALIIAAKKNDRMNSKKPRLLHELCGRPICDRMLDVLRDAGASKCIVAAAEDEVRDYLDGKCEFMTLNRKNNLDSVLRRTAENEGRLLIITDVLPLLTARTVKGALNFSQTEDIDAVIRTDNNENVPVMYILDSKTLLKALDENYAKSPDVLRKLEAVRINAAEVDDLYIVNDLVHFARANTVMRKRINEAHMRAGVTMLDPSCVTVEDGVVIGADTVINRNVIIKAGSVIGNGCYIGMGTTLDRAVIRDNVSIESSVIIDSEVMENTNVGPFAYIRPGSVVGKNVKVGDFVELKNAIIGDDTKIAHLTYVGDADVGERVNFGCGTVVVNYDGQNKQRTTIGNDVFIGCNTNLVSPVVVNDGAFTAAGSTITEEVPENALAIARARQVNKTGWERPKKIKK